MRTVPLKSTWNSLPVGLVILDGGEPVVHRNVDIGPITGKVRVALAAPTIRDSPAAQSTTMLAMTLRHLGPMSAPITEGITRKLSYIDREFLLWVQALLKFGDKPVEIAVTCQHCSAELEADLTVSDLQVNVLEDEDYTWVAAERVFAFTHPEFGEMKARILTGEDTERISAYQNREELTLRTIHAAIYSIDGKKISFEDLLAFEVDKLDWIEAALGSIELGARQVVSINCQRCGNSTEAHVDPFVSSAASGPPKVLPPYETRS